MTNSYAPRRVLVAGQVDVQSPLWQKPLRVNGRRVLFACAVVQDFGRLHDGQLHVNRNGVSLIRPDKGMALVEGIPLFFGRVSRRG